MKPSQQTPSQPTSKNAAQDAATKPRDKSAEMSKKARDDKKDEGSCGC